VCNSTAHNYTRFLAFGDKSKHADGSGTIGWCPVVSLLDLASHEA
jgi:hypothetical protein